MKVAATQATPVTSAPERARHIQSFFLTLRMHPANTMQATSTHRP